MDLDESVPQDEKLRLSHCLHRLTCEEALVGDKAAIKAEIESAVETHGMSEWYNHFATQSTGLWPRNDALIAKLRAANDAKVVELDAAIKDAEENLGESEIKDAQLAKAKHYDSIGDLAKALEFYDDAVGVGKGGTVGQRIDCALAKIRLAMVFKDRELATKQIAECHKLVEEGGDWERRNRLKVYESVHLLSNREFKKAAELLLESLATFTCLELVTYEEYIFYTVVAAAVSLDRVTLKKKVLHAPEILSVIDNIPGLKDFVNALYNCDYATFFQNFPTIVDQLFTNRYLVEHVKYFEREMCVVAYTQFLESYRSVTVSSMAAAFGVSEPFLDAELSRYIATGRLHAKIDKVGGVVETNRPDAKNALYQDAIKKGDALLNRIQKLSRVINV